jgi:hypothetical protein
MNPYDKLEEKQGEDLVGMSSNSVWKRFRL